MGGEIGVDTGTIGIGAEHAELHATVRRWAQAHIDPVATRAILDLAPADVTRPPFWADLRERGWLGLAVAEEHGGEGYGLVELAIVLEELGRVCAPGPFLPTVLTAAIVGATGSATLQAEILPRLASGEWLGATAVPRADGHVVTSLVATAPPTPASVPSNESADPAFDVGSGEMWLNGSTGPLLAGSVPDVVIVPVVVEDGATRWCVLSTAQPGVTVRALASTDATRVMVEVTAHDAVVGVDRQLTHPDTATTIAALAATLLAAEATGAMAWCVATAAAHARDRVQFGRPIGQFQAVKHRVAAMLLALEQARAGAWDAARGADDDRERRLAAAVAGAIVPPRFFETTKDCIQVLGGVGYTWDHDAHLYIKRATALQALLGGSAPWRAQVAALSLAGVRRSLTVDLGPEAETMREEVRSFAAATKDLDRSEWTATMADAGYLVPYWPPPWGRGAGPLEQLVIDDELAKARLRRPHLQVGGWVLPTLIAHGTPEQQERWIRPTLHGQILWCQLFSEPGAGSDLASLSTRAVRDDDRGGWVVTGQKVWTTMAHLSNWGILLARTDPAAPKHDGITCFVLDMASARIDIRPLRELTGAELFNEVFLDSVFVPDDCVVGAVNRGWEAARTTLANERVSMGSGSSFGPGVEAVIEMVRGGDRAGDAVMLDSLGDLVATGQSIAVLGLRMTLRALSAAGPGAEASVRKLLATEHEQATQEVGLELLGSAATSREGDAGRWIDGFLGNRALSIAGGTSDIQRNVVAERLLGLPKDPEPGS